jgi:transcriptional regulator with XRE-family HTH domain
MQQFEAAEIGARIKQAQRERGLLQHELAAMASFSQRSLQDYQSGVTIPYKHLTELSRLLGKPVEWFLRGDEAVNVEEERLREIIREEVAAALAPLLELLRDRLAPDDPDDDRDDPEHDQDRYQRPLRDTGGEHGAPLRLRPGAG